MKTIYIDDGSTNVKMLWKNDQEEVVTAISPNSFRRGFSAPMGEDPVYNYEFDGGEYSFSESSTDTLPTNDVSWQYSVQNCIAVHHALLTSGINPQPVHIVVTLPLSEFFDNKNQPNQANIARKKESLARKINVINNETFTIEKVTVCPESIPAALKHLAALDDDDSLLVVDIGGTTLDVALMQGRRARVVKVKGDRNIGVSSVTEELMAAMAASKNKTSWSVVEKMIKRRQEDEYLKGRLIHKESLPAVKNAINDAIKGLSANVIEFIRAFEGYTHIAVVGGGATLIADNLQKATDMPDSNFFVSECPQLDLVKGLTILVR